MAKFELNENEIRACNEFIKNLPKKYKNKNKKFIFSDNSGIGTVIKIKIGKKKKDITDYKSW